MNIKTKYYFLLKAGKNHVRPWGELCGQFSCLNATMSVWLKVNWEVGQEVMKTSALRTHSISLWTVNKLGDIPHRSQTPPKQSNTRVELKWIKHLQRETWFLNTVHESTWGKKLAARRDLTSSFVRPDEGDGSDCAGRNEHSSSVRLLRSSWQSVWIRGKRSSRVWETQSFSGPWLWAGWFYGRRCRRLQSSAARQ